MTLLIVPHSADHTTARVWLAAVDTATAPSTRTLHVHGVGDVAVPEQGWRPVTAGGALSAGESRTFVQTVTVEGLEPGVRYVVQDGDAHARFATLPVALPRHGIGTFNVLLASCFYVGGEKSAAIGAAIRDLPDHLAPHVKFLCGDQVYLDFPAFVFGLPIGEASLARSFLDKYRRNWSQAAGYQDVLREGATYFTADDHEFWNNYPNAATLIGNTWFAEGRDLLTRVGRSLFEDFQCEAPGKAGANRRFDVGRLSFLVVDTRLGRAPGNERFLDEPHLDEVIGWIEGLSGPGVLVVGQPIFEKPASWLARRVVDRTLANYAQYKTLVAALSRAPHSVLVLSGDVHFGRVVRAVFVNGAATTEIAEVIASPSSLVFGRHGEPDTVTRFPPEAIEGVPQANRIHMHAVPVRAANHFATLHVSEVPGRVHVAVRHWYFDPSQTGPRFTENRLELS